jgi:hypothetical protein
MSTVFTRFEVYHVTRGGTLLMWDVSPAVKGSSLTYQFTVQASKSGVGDWIDVTTLDNTNHFFIDPAQYVWAKNPELHYRVALTVPNKPPALSGALQINRGLNTHDQAIVNEIMRKEQLQLEQYSGACGYLYKRRHWGVRCTVCTDFNTGESKNANCSTCYGTGFVGGYFDPVRYWIAPSNKSQRRTSIEPTQGTVDPVVELGRGVACPWVESYDVWVSSRSDARYIIHTVKDVRYRDVPIIFDPIELRLAPGRDPVYKLPRPDLEIA